MSKNTHVQSVGANELDVFFALFKDLYENSSLASEGAAVRAVLDNEVGLFAEEIFSAFQVRVKKYADMITRSVVVDPKIRMITALAYISIEGTMGVFDRDVPATTGGDFEVVLFKADRALSVLCLREQFDCRGLEPVNPYVLAALNMADLKLAKDHPNLTYWPSRTTGSESWGIAVFDKTNDGYHRVCVNSVKHIEFDKGMWYGGVLKP